MTLVVNVLTFRNCAPGSRGGGERDATDAEILSSNTDMLSPRMVSLIADWRRTGRVSTNALRRVPSEIEPLAEQDESCQRIMSVPGIVPS
jgi:hypothetical protein